MKTGLDQASCLVLLQISTNGSAEYPADSTSSKLETFADGTRSLNVAVAEEAE